MSADLRPFRFTPQGVEYPYMEKLYAYAESARLPSASGGYGFRPGRSGGTR